MAHPDYPDGFPPIADESLLGRHTCAGQIVDVGEHEHGYELRFYHLGPVVTVAGDRPDAVLAYLAVAGERAAIARLAELEPKPEPE